MKLHRSRRAPRTARRLVARRGVSALVAVLALALPASALAATYYVAPTGSDTAAGTASAPWRTVAKVNGAALGAGDVVLFQGGGVWREMLVPRSGTAGAPVTFGGYGAGRPVLEGQSASGYAAVELNGKHDVVVRDFEMRNRRSGTSLVYLRGASNVRLDDVFLHDADTGVLASPSAPSSNVEVSDSVLRSFVSATNTGVAVNIGTGTTGFTLRDSEVTGAADSCVIDLGTGSTYLRDRVSECGYLLTAYGTHGMYMKGPRQTIRDSEISRGRSNCVSIRYQDVVVEGNRLHDCPIGLAWFENASAQGRATIRGNRIWGTSTGLYLDFSDGVSTQIFDIANNTVVGAGGSQGIVAGNARGLNLENNLVTGGVGRALSVGSVGAGGYRERHNVWHSTGTATFAYRGSVTSSFATYRTASGQGSGSLTADPALGTGAPTFVPSAGSPIVDRGTVSTASGALVAGCDGLIGHYCGAAPEPGAVELGTVSAPAPAPTPAPAPEVEPADTTAPTVSFRAPAARSTVSGTIGGPTCEVTASDAVGVAAVDILLDGKLLNRELFAPYNCATLDTRTLVNGAHTLTARASDAAGNVGSGSVSFTVSNPDVQAPSTPVGLQAAAARTSVWLSWDDATDNVGVARYRVFRDGSLAATVTDPWATVAGLRPNTSSTYRVAAVDAAGNVSPLSVGLTVRTRRTTSTTLKAASAARSTVTTRTSVALRVGKGGYVVVDGVRRVLPNGRGSVVVRGFRPGSEHAFIVRRAAGSRDHAAGIRILSTRR